MYFGASRGKRCSIGVRTGKTKHLMPSRYQFINNGGANETSGAGNKDTHVRVPQWIHRPVRMID
ncbi:hypothetical protein GCM10011408_00940 [Dyella caseinilytica]|nr:hypothetical protein GCM10011408_00940 [Dyella caseinilytica]